ncbi:MAG: GGDEF domain-containing protein [Actinomycetota bacterium]
MVVERGPHVVATSSQEPEDGDGRVAAYLGVALCRPDGTLFGVLTGVTTERSEAELRDALALAELVARLLGGLLAAGLQAATDAREHDRAGAREQHDGVTGLADRSHWDRVLAGEESRCRRYGDRAAIVVIELEEHGTLEAAQGPEQAQILLRRTARVLRNVCREEDLVARVAPGTFAVLSVGADGDGAAAFVDRLAEQLAANDVRASVRFRARDPRLGLHAAWRLLSEVQVSEQRRPA